MILCPKYKRGTSQKNNRVIDTKHPVNKNVIKRVRMCLYCNHAFITEEREKGTAVLPTEAFL